MRATLGDERRLLGVDVARCLALVGMMSVHIFPPQRGDGSLHPAYVVAAGRSAALFAVLAGVSIALVSGRTEPPRGRARADVSVAVAVRGLLLVALGLALGHVDSPPLVILAYYGLLFLFALPVLGLGTGGLLGCAAVAAVVTPQVSQLWRMHVSPTPVDEPTLGVLLPKTLLLTGTYPVLTWTTYLFLGMALGRLDLRRTSDALRLLLGGAAVAVAAKLVSGALVGAAGGADRLQQSLPADSLYATDTQRWLDEGLYGTTPTESWRWLLVSSPHSGTTLDLLHTCGTSAAVLGLCLLLVQRAPRWSYLPLAAAGSMTLTLYTCHVLALTQDNPLVLDDSLHLWALHVLVAVLVATAWRGFVGRGPLEALLAAIDRAVRAAVTGTARRRDPVATSGRGEQDVVRTGDGPPTA